MKDDGPCPFKPGDTVLYKPSLRGMELATPDMDDKLRFGKKCKVAAVVKERYVVVEGLEQSPGGGIYWTEFQKPD
jgi:hypothetical protein